MAAVAAAKRGGPGGGGLRGRGSGVRGARGGGRGSSRVSHMTRPGEGQKFSDLVALMQKQAKVKKAQGDPEALRKLVEDQDEDTKCVRCLECFGKAGLNHLALYTIMLLYAFAGAGLFQWLEEENEIQQRSERLTRLNESVGNLTQAIIALDGVSDREVRVKGLLRDYQSSEDLLPQQRRNWDFWGALFFAGTIFTTIGYGHYVPVTRWGQVATMCYAVIGIPLVLAILSDLGKLLTKFFKLLYSWFRRLKRRKDRKRWAAATEETDSYREWMESDELDIPIPLAIGIFFGWIFLCSAIFCIWETEWDFFTAFYFFFISLTTIGLGDVTPNHPRYVSG